MANITEITIENTVKESRQIMNNNFANLNEGLSTNNYAPLASPALTGTPTAPTAATGTNTTQLATTAFVNSSITANAYTLPTATSSVLGGVKVGSNITLSSGLISLTASNVKTALGFTPLSLAGGTMTGALTLSGAPTADLQAATKSYVDDKVASVVNSAPATLDTLNELATALGNDANFSTTMATALGNKVDTSDVVTTATASKILKLDGNAKLPADITGTAAKATADGSGNVITSTYANKPVIVTTTWTASSTTLTVTNSAITATSLVTLGVPTTITSTQYDALGTAEIICTAQSAGSITLTALGTAPTVDIPIELTIVG